MHGANTRASVRAKRLSVDFPKASGAIQSRMLVQSQCSGRLDRAIDAGAVHVKVPATHTRLVEVVEEIHGDRVRTGRPVAFDLEGLRRASRLTGLRRLRSTDLHAVDVDTGEGWVARFRFSFLSDVTGLYRFRRRGRKPTTATLDRVAQAIMANLPACRRPGGIRTGTSMRSTW